MQAFQNFQVDCAKQQQQRRGEEKEGTQLYLCTFCKEMVLVTQRVTSTISLFGFIFIQGYCTLHQLIVKAELLSYRHACAPSFWGDKPDPMHSCHYHLATLTQCSGIHHSGILVSPNIHPRALWYCFGTSSLSHSYTCRQTNLHKACIGNKNWSSIQWSLWRLMSFLWNTVIYSTTHEAMPSDCCMSEWGGTFI